MTFKVLKHDVIYTGRVIDLFVDQIEYPSGNRGIREVASHPGGAVAVPLYDDGRVVLVRQYRHPLGKFPLELPAGKLDPGEDPRLCALRELQEETGLQAGRWEKLASIHTTPGFCDEQLHLFLATGLSESPGGHNRGEGETGMEVHTILLSEALELIERGGITDAKTICGLLLVGRRLKGVEK